MGVEYVKTLTKLLEILLISKNMIVVTIKRVGGVNQLKSLPGSGAEPGTFRDFDCPNRFENEIEFFSL